MSGFAAVLRRDGRSVERAWMEARLRSWVGPTTPLTFWSAGAVGLASWVHPGRPGALTGRQATWARRPGLTLVGEVRLDNKAELRGRWGDETTAAATDAELVLDGYRQLGDRAWDLLAGDFAGVLWDAEQQRLVAVRDLLGVRQLVYASTSWGTALASRTGAVVAFDGGRPAPNHAFLKALLARHYEPWLRDTAHVGVHRVRAGHRLAIGPEGLEEAPYGQLGGRPVRGLTTDEAWLAELRQRLATAVAARLETGERAAVLVGGGLDSSAIACLAHGLATAGEDARTRPDVALFSFHFESTPRAQEGEYFDAVVASCPGFGARRVPADDLWALRELGATAGFPADEPEVEVSRALLGGLLAAVTADRRPVVLAGNFADQVQLANAYEATGLLRDLDPRRLTGELPHFLRLSRHPRPAVWAFAHWHRLVPRRLQRWAVDRWERRRRPPMPHQAPSAKPDRSAGSTAAAIIQQAVAGGLAAAALVSLDSLGLCYGVDLRFPFLDRRLLELYLCLPPHLLFAEGRNKLALRRALAGVLPSLVRERRSAAYFDELIDRGLSDRERDKVLRLVTSPEAERLGLVGAGHAAQLYRHYLEREGKLGGYRDLAAFLCVESWLRQTEPLRSEGPAELYGSTGCETLEGVR